MRENDEPDITLLQETLITHEKYFLQTYTTHTLPGVRNQTRGCIALIKNSIKAKRIDNPINCGEHVEVLAVEIELQHNSLKIYNIYKQIRAELDLEELCQTTQHEEIIIAGDFNAHHSILNSQSPTNQAGRNIFQCLENVPHISILNTGETTHQRGNVLDLTLISTTLKANAQWKIHPSITSDHFAIITKLDLPKVSPPEPVKRRNLKKADWNKFQEIVTNVMQEQDINNNINVLERNLTEANEKVMEEAIPLTKPTKRIYKDHWYYSTEVKMIKNQINRARKKYRKNRTEENRANLREVINEASTQLKEIKANKLLEWTETLGKTQMMQHSGNN